MSHHQEMKRKKSLKKNITKPDDKSTSDKKVKAEDEQDDGQKDVTQEIFSCSICLENEPWSDVWMKSDCGQHHFHKECIKQWPHNSCPNCRQAVDQTKPITKPVDEDEEATRAAIRNIVGQVQQLPPEMAAILQLAFEHDIGRVMARQVGSDQEVMFHFHFPANMLSPEDEKGEQDHKEDRPVTSECSQCHYISEEVNITCPGCARRICTSCVETHNCSVRSDQVPCTFCGSVGVHETCEECNDSPYCHYCLDGHNCV